MQEQRPKILFVDDEEQNLLAFRLAFKKVYQVFVANSGQEGLDLLQKEDVQVIISDQRMPEMTGVEFLKQARQNYPEPVRIILTGFSDMEAIMAAINEGEVYRYLNKPWNKQELRNTIDNALEVFYLKEENKNLIVQLKDANHGLELKVKARTLELEEKNTKLTASIQYAQYIQDAVLSEMDDLQTILPESFVLFKPRDIVSGDFYWFTEVEPQPLFQQKASTPAQVPVLQGFSSAKSLIAAVDCTGHGVPGAFMSMIGNILLNEIVNEKKITQPAKILNHLHDAVFRALRQDQKHNFDGMDISLCMINQEENILEFAGAKNALYVVQEDELRVIPADKFPIGGIWSNQSRRNFQNHQIPLKPGMSFFICSDGFQDQFGGPKNRKFMKSRLRQLFQEIHALPPAEQKSRMESSLHDWMGQEDQVDDILVIGFRV